MEIQTTNIGGKNIRHKDVVHYNTTSTFTWRQRMKILFGGKVHIYSVILTMNNKVEVVETASITRIGDKLPPVKPVQAVPKPVMAAVK